MKLYYNCRKFFIISLLSFAVVLTGFFDLPRAQRVSSDQRVAVITFHAVSKDFEPNPTVISQDELEKTFQLMQQRGYRPINLEQFHGFIDGKIGVPQKAVLITFDDGYEDNFLLAYPMAQKYNFPAVIFAVAKWFSDYPRPEPHRPHLSADQAKTLMAKGLWSIAGHSYDGHRKVSGEKGPGSFYTTMVADNVYRESDLEYKARLWTDVSLTAFTLEKFGVKPVDFAFPYGSYNDTIKEILLKSGYKYFYTNDPGLNSPGQDPKHIFRLSSAPTADENLALLDYYFGNQ